LRDDHEGAKYRLGVTMRLNWRQIVRRMGQREEKSRQRVVNVHQKGKSGRSVVVALPNYTAPATIQDLQSLTSSHSEPCGNPK
jgi:hypothetical protein